MMSQQLFSVGFICILFLFTLGHPMHCLDNFSYTDHMYFKFIFVETYNILTIIIVSLKRITQYGGHFLF